MFERIKEMFERRAELSPEQIQELTEMIRNELCSYKRMGLAPGEGPTQLERLYYDLLAARRVASAAGRFI